jgi:hypothetical protein
MIKMMRPISIGLFLFAACCSALDAQSAMPTTNILFKTFMIRTKTDEGTMFSIDVDDREYWLTAKHILTGRKSGPAGEVTEKSVSLDVLDPVGEAVKWNPVEFTVIDPGKDIDIVVLVPESPLQEPPIPSLKVLSGNVGMGGECSFLGYPYANTWTATFSNSAGSAAYKMPFIKHCYISGIIRGPASMFVLDGINNFGFSGGPVLYDTGPNQVVIGVISGYHTEPGEVHSIEIPNPSSSGTSQGARPNATRKENVVDLNSGIIIAYMAELAVDAIKKHPVGRPFAAAH